VLDGRDRSQAAQPDFDLVQESLDVNLFGAWRLAVEAPAQAIAVGCRRRPVAEVAVLDAIRVVLSVNAVLAQLEREPNESIVDPWVAERRCLVAERDDEIVVAALLHRFRADEDVREGYRGAGDIRWLVCKVDAVEAGAQLLEGALAQMSVSTREPSGCAVVLRERRPTGALTSSASAGRFAGARQALEPVGYCFPTNGVVSCPGTAALSQLLSWRAFAGREDQRWRAVARARARRPQ